jgi:SAM-dependent methyltransferase
MTSDAKAAACPVCGAPPEEAVLFLEESIDPAKMSGFSYASRKTPEYMSHRLVRCTTCDLVYAANPPAQDVLAQAYHQAEYDSAEEAADAADAYVRAMAPTLARLAGRDGVLEIGSGTGVLLERLQDLGFTGLVGIEPSAAAIAAAPAHRRAWLREGIFREEDFAPQSFDLICCFMTLEHVRDPLAVARSARRLLRPGGALVTVTHDYESLVNRLLGRKSPIIDIEHMQIFADRSIRALFERAGFSQVSARPFRNRYALRYWLRLAPLPGGLKSLADKILGATGLGRLKLAVNVGNTLAAGFRQDAPP